MMREKKIDYLVIQNSEEFLGGTLRWFTDFGARHQFPMTAIFPVDDEMTTIVCGGDPPADQFPPAWAARGIKKRLGAVYFPTYHFTATYDAELAADFEGDGRFVLAKPVQESDLDRVLNLLEPSVPLAKNGAA